MHMLRQQTTKKPQLLPLRRLTALTDLTLRLAPALDDEIAIAILPSLVSLRRLDMSHCPELTCCALAMVRLLTGLQELVR